MSKKYGKKSLENIFLDDWSMALVLDDREDVWMTSNQHHHLLQVRSAVDLFVTYFLRVLGASISL